MRRRSEPRRSMSLRAIWCDQAEPTVGDVPSVANSDGDTRAPVILVSGAADCGFRKFWSPFFRKF